MIIEHKYKKLGDSYATGGFCHVWSIIITHNDRTYEIDIENVDSGYKSYWNGFITEYDEDGDEKLNIVFNNEDVYNNLSCMLIGIKEIINGDFSNTSSSDFYYCEIL